MRLYLLTRYYRLPLDYSERELQECARRAERLALRARTPVAGGLGELDDEAWRRDFFFVLNDDLDTARAIEVLESLADAISEGARDSQTTGRAQKTLRELSALLGLQLPVHRAGA